MLSDVVKPAELATFVVVTLAVVVSVLGVTLKVNCQTPVFEAVSEVVPVATYVPTASVPVVRSV